MNTDKEEDASVPAATTKTDHKQPPLSAKFDEEALNRERSKSKSRSPEKAKSGKSAKTKSGKSRRSGKSVRSVKSSRSSRSRKSAKSAKSPKRKSTAEVEDMSDLGLTIIDHKIFEKTTLRKLILSGNNLRSIPSSIGDLFNLEYLDVSKNPLRVKDAEDASCFPVEMRLLKVLKEINISECNLRHVPTTVWMCSSLERLDLSRNKVGLLVPDVGNLQNLQYINLSQCNLSTLPSEIGFCAELREIVLMGNQIESLPDSLKDCDNLEYLRLSYRNFSTMLDAYMDNLIFKGQIKSEHIPVVVFELKSMISLDLKHTKINTVPDNNLCGLRELNLDFNYVSTLVEGSMKSMANIRILTLSNNFLKEIPAEINTLLSLEVLDLSFNSITSITNNSNLANLKEFYLTCNKLEEINENIKYFVKLEKLKLDRNSISEIADELYTLQWLNYLDLCYNKLIQLSDKIINLKGLKIAHSYTRLERLGLWLIGNPLKIPASDYWSTQRIDKMYNYLASYHQRNLDYVFYSKLIFVGESGVGKSRLVDSFYFIVDTNEKRKEEYKTKIARKLFKRTINKVEWSLLDLGGDPIYRSFFSMFFSSIDPVDEPSLFVIVYNHTEYTSHEHEKHIGAYLNSILMHTRTQTVQIKLVGIVDDVLFDFYDENKEEEFKMNNILNECGCTIDEYYQKLIEEKVSLTDAEKIAKIDALLKRRVYLNGDIFLIETNFSKESIAKLLTCLENITIGFNQTVPLELKIKLKNHLTKLKKRSLSAAEFEASINKNVQLHRLMKMYERYNLNTQKIINYAKTMIDIFWMKFDRHLCDEVYLHFNYLINTFKAIIRHDLIETQLVYNDQSVFKSIRLFDSEASFLDSVSKFKQYGLIEWKLLTGICFEFDQLERNDIEKCMEIWRKFLIAYKSETEFLERNSSFLNIIIPSQCVDSFDANQVADMKELYTNEYENYFLRIDKTKEYVEQIKEENIIKKKRYKWKFKENQTSDSHSHESPNYEDEESEPLEFENELKLTNINTIKLVDLNHDDSHKKKLFKSSLECCSNINLDKEIFNKLSCLMQSMVNERFDWCDTIIARDNENNYFKVRFVSNKLLIEIKSHDESLLNKLTNQFVDIIDYLFTFYPGLLLILNIK